MKRIFLFLVLLGAVVAAGGLVWAKRFPEIAAISRPNPASFDKALVKQGEKLAGLGNCHVCHSVSGGKPFAGGLALPTPFGTIYTTNITPDVETGIGGWSEEAFIRAMREGVDREGDYLYPAFPYDYYTHVATGDLKAIYAYLMTREPVKQEAKENKLGFPFNIRLLMAGWNLLFHQSGEWKPDPTKDNEWNRGAYIVEGLGHCGACHTPRNVFGAAAKSGPDAYSGGVAEGWMAPALNGKAWSPIPWTGKALVNYLIDGWDQHHGLTGGPMTAVATDLYDQSEDDVFAIAAYVMSLKGPAKTPEEQEKIVAAEYAKAARLEWGHAQQPALPSDPLLQKGAKVFESQCITCHKADGKSAPLALTSVMNAPDSYALIDVTYNGIKPPRGSLDRSMPARASQISDEDMVALAAFVRARFTSRPAWTGVDALAKSIRSGAH